MIISQNSGQTHSKILSLMLQYCAESVQHVAFFEGLHLRQAPDGFAVLVIQEQIPTPGQKSP